MWLNRALEWMRRQPRTARLVRARALRASEQGRPPVVVVPSILGTKLRDQRGRSLWGSLPRLIGGPRPVDRAAPPATVDGLLEGFSAVPGLWQVDLFGGLARFLAAVGGYRAGQDLFVHLYDWRQELEAGADALAARLATLDAERVDLVGISTGGLVIRHLLARGEVAIPRIIRRTVFVGTPHHGSMSALAALLEGVRLVPFGRRLPGAALAAFPVVWETLPAPDEPVFVDTTGASVAADLYDPTVWRALGLAADGAFADLGEKLAAGRAAHARRAAGVPKDAIVIAARHQETRARLLVDGGRAHLPACEPRRRDPHRGLLYEPGDGAVPARSLVGLPGLDPMRVWWAQPREHHLMPADPLVHRYVLEALLATDRTIPATDLARTRGSRRRLPIIEPPRNGSPVG